MLKKSTNHRKEEKLNKTFYSTGAKLFVIFAENLRTKEKTKTYDELIFSQTTAFKRLISQSINNDHRLHKDCYSIMMRKQVFEANFEFQKS
jgi:hypothetical protein